MILFFDQADTFINEVVNIISIRNSMNPNVKIDIDEIGVILPDDNVDDPIPIPDPYWNAAGAMYAYLVGNLAPLGINILGQSQLVGYPTQFPSVSLVDWDTGLPNARLRVLALLIDYLPIGSKLVDVIVSDNTQVFALGFLSNDDNLNVLLINKVNEDLTVHINDLQSGLVTFVDQTTGNNPPVTSTFNDTINLGGWSVAIARLV